MTWEPGQRRVGFGRRLFLLRFGRLKLSQKAFADRYGLSLGAVKDAEQNRVTPSRALMSLVAVIEHDPKAAAMAIAASISDTTL